MNAGATFAAPAKLNLMLRVVGRRPDGYHLLQTVFRFIDAGDTLSFNVRQDGVIARVRAVNGVPAEADLTLRAARALQQGAGTALGADIDLVKRIPLGAGLGGGSSDAGTALLALNHLWGTGLSRADLLALAVKLGADVPVFVFGENALAEGIGEVLSPIALPPAWYVVLTPPVHVPTARVFAHPDLKRDSQMIKMHGFSADVRGNDLEPVVARLYPEVATYLEWLRRRGEAQMTGSGAAVFASFDSEDAALGVLRQLPAGMKGFVARGLAQHPLRDLAR